MGATGEFEASRVLPAPRDVAFAVASDPAGLDAWLPPGVHVEPLGDDVVRADGPAVPDAPQEGLATTAPEQYRLEWGSRGDDRYAGWLQVHARGDDDTDSEVTLHLSFAAELPQAHAGAAGADVERMLDESLDRLARAVAARHPAAGADES